LYCLLLPSGNNAVICLAEGCGKLLINAWKKNIITRNSIRKTLIKSILDPIKTFIQCMNRLVLQYTLTRT